MRKPIIAGNWKMHTTVGEAVALVDSMREYLDKITSVDSVVCPPFVALSAVAAALKSSRISVGAQNMHWETKGAYTGEIAPGMLVGMCQYVILGHSERREYFGETDEGVNRKLKAAQAWGLTPIICVGETEAQYDAGQTESVVQSQVAAAVENVTPEQAARLVIAYEPIWAIGTGKAASAEEANSVIGRTIRATLAQLYDSEIAELVRIQYGGSTKPANIAEYMLQPHIDGALVGGASLRAESFVEMMQITDQLRS
jgi:triosephosphate isomerase